MERAKRSTATFRFCFVLLVGRKINLWTEVFARSFSRNNFSFAFQENGEKCASYCGGFQRAFIALALIVSVILESFKLSYFFSFSSSSCFSSSFSSSYHHLFPPRNTQKKKKKKEEGEQKREIKRYSRVRTSRSALSSRGSLMKQYEWLWRYGGAHKSILRMLEDSSQLSIYRIDFSRHTRRIDYRLISSARWKSIVIFHRPRRFQRGLSISTIYIYIPAPVSPPAPSLPRRIYFNFSCRRRPFFSGLILCGFGFVVSLVPDYELQLRQLPSTTNYNSTTTTQQREATCTQSVLCHKPRGCRTGRGSGRCDTNCRDNGSVRRCSRPSSPVDDCRSSNATRSRP